MQVSRPSLQDMIGVRIAQSCVFSSQERRSSGLATSLQRLSGAGTICCSQLKSLLPILPAPCSSDNRPGIARGTARRRRNPHLHRRTLCCSRPGPAGIQSRRIDAGAWAHPVQGCADPSRLRLLVQARRAPRSVHGNTGVGANVIHGAAAGAGIGRTERRMKEAPGTAVVAGTVAPSQLCRCLSSAISLQRLMTRLFSLSQLR